MKKEKLIFVFKTEGMISASAISAKHIDNLVEVLKLYGYKEADKKPNLQTKNKIQ